MLSKDILVDLYENKKLTTYQIAIKYDVNRSTICNWLKKNNIQLRNKQLEYEINKDIRLSNLQKDILIGTLLGDGHIAITKSGRLARFSISHSLKQKEYINLKFNLLDPIARPMKKHKAFNKSILKEYEFLSFYTKATKELLDFHSIFYVNNKKVIKESLFKYFKSPQSLAIWFMDDGYLDKNRAIICTDCFNYNELIILKAILLENFNLNAKIIKNGKYLRLRFGVKETIKLSKIIENYVIESMKYKLVNVHSAPAGYTGENY